MVKKDAPDGYLTGLRVKNWILKYYYNFKAFFHLGSLNKVPFRGPKSKNAAIHFRLKIVF